MLIFFFFIDPATTEIYTLSLHYALPISTRIPVRFVGDDAAGPDASGDIGKTPEELGRESSYDDADEMARRIESGVNQETGEGKGDAPGSTDPSEQPRSRNEQDTTVSHTDPQGQIGRASCRER